MKSLLIIGLFLGQLSFANAGYADYAVGGPNDEGESYWNYSSQTFIDGDCEIYTHEDQDFYLRETTCDHGVFTGRDETAAEVAASTDSEGDVFTENTK